MLRIVSPDVAVPSVPPERYEAFGVTYSVSYVAVNAVTVTSTTHGIYTVCTFIYNAIASTPHPC